MQDLERPDQPEDGGNIQVSEYSFEEGSTFMMYTINTNCVYCYCFIMSFCRMYTINTNCAYCYCFIMSFCRTMRGDLSYPIAAGNTGRRIPAVRHL